MKKDILLKHLEEAIKREESATTIYLQHLHAFSQRVIFDPNFLKKFKSTVEYLIAQNKRHKEIGEEIYRKVQKEKKDDI